MQYQDSRQDVTGLVVNKKVSVRQEYWRTARAMANNLFKTGEFTIKKIATDAGGNRIVDYVNGSREQLNGILSFIDSIDSYNKNKNDDKKRLLNSREKVYQEFLFYKNFFTAEKPLIICEGKTDNIYIKAAILKLYKDFPSLCEEDKDGKKALTIKLYPLLIMKIIFQIVH